MIYLSIFTLLLAGCASTAGDEWLRDAFSKNAVWPVKDTQSDGGGK